MPLLHFKKPVLIIINLQIWIAQKCIVYTLHIHAKCLACICFSTSWTQYMHGSYSGFIQLPTQLPPNCTDRWGAQVKKWARRLPVT